MNRAAHDAVGVGAGALLSLYHAGDQTGGDRMLEVFGGCLGGFLGSRLPDKIDPPTSPNHRGIGHGVCTVGGVTYTLWDLLQLCQSELRAKADELRAERAELDSDWHKFLNQALEWLCRILAGMLMGVVGGYASHLILDGTTPKGLPAIA